MIPLMVRSHFSLMAGTAAPAALVRRARAAGYGRLALTDTDNLYGLWPFLSACRQEGIGPMIGAAISEPESSRQAVCLVENLNGYQNLCRLITRRHTDATFRLETALPEHARGLIVLVGDPALLCPLHEAGITVFGAVARRPDGAGLHLRREARRLGLAVAAVPDTYFLRPEDMAIHRLLAAIAANTSLSRLCPAQIASKDAWLAPPEAYTRRFAVWPETLAAADQVAERLSFTGPEFGLVMPPWTDAAGRPAASALREAAYAGAARRYGDALSETVCRRLEHELSVISKMGFSSYFLVVKDIVSQSPRICGRGSAAASLVAYCLGITNVCPVKHDLYFARFLNPGRKDAPDIDVDFAWDERDALIDSVLARYRDHAAMVCNHVCFKPRMAIREVAKVYGIPAGEINRVTRKLPWFWHLDEADDALIETIRALPRLSGFDFPDPWPEMLQLAGRIVGVPRNLSVHPGGVVITPFPITDYVPVQRAAKGVAVIQWEKDGAEKAGLVKIDLLGNRSLGVIRDAVENLAENATPIDERRWQPEDDPATVALVARGETMGCFYIESPAMRLLQQKTGVGDFSHLVIHSSIIRPAANDFIREYVRRLHGGHWTPIHPLLADVLAETYGIMVYQEDVSRVAVALAGFSDVDADGLRKIMSKKDKGRHLSDYRRQFVEGAGKHGLCAQQIEALWAMMMSFSGYSFCKPHSASYARVSFQAAWLKTHHPAEFMAAVISNGGGFYSPFAYVSEARRLGVTVLAPDVNESLWRWKGRAGAIRVGWMSLKHLSAQTAQRLVLERENRAYQSFSDVLERVHPAQDEARALIFAGALDALHPGVSRAALLWELACRQKTGTAPGAQLKLFSQSRLLEAPAFPPEASRERLRQQFRTLGFLCEGHPMAFYREGLKRQGVVSAADLSRHVGARVSLAGVLITGKTVYTKHGDPMQFLTFEDETGLAETTFFPEAYRRFCALLEGSRPFVLTGKVEQDFGAVTLTVDAVSPLVRRR
jgi:error-prone DNA polymerase